MGSPAESDSVAGPKCWNSAKFPFSALNTGLYDVPLTMFILCNKLHVITVLTYIYTKKVA